MTKYITFLFYLLSTSLYAQINWSIHTGIISDTYNGWIKNEKRLAPHISSKIEYSLDKEYSISLINSYSIGTSKYQFPDESHGKESIQHIQNMLSLHWYPIKEWNIFTGLSLNYLLRDFSLYRDRNLKSSYQTFEKGVHIGTSYLHNRFQFSLLYYNGFTIDIDKGKGSDFVYFINIKSVNLSIGYLILNK